MFVACSTRCFSREPLESALRHIAELEFSKFDLALVEDGTQLRPSEVAENPETALQRVRQGPNLTPTALDLDFGANDPKVVRRRFEAMCRLAKPLTVAVLTIPAARLGTPFDDEVTRLTSLTEIALREGLVPAVATDSLTLTADPAVAAALCKAVPGLGLTLDPSHYINGPHQGGSFDEVYPFVQNVHLRDSGKGPDEFQVRVGQGNIEYGRIVNQLERHGYNRALTVAILDDRENPFDVEIEVRKLKLLLESLI
ncbi:MAG: sugar phosphate isomerase/epimerase [Isosphaeraceae bacterium]